MVVWVPGEFRVRGNDWLSTCPNKCGHIVYNDLEALLRCTGLGERTVVYPSIRSKQVAICLASVLNYQTSGSVGCRHCS